jgi:hypothetical protein
MSYIRILRTEQAITFRYVAGQAAEDKRLWDSSLFLKAFFILFSA